MREGGREGRGGKEGEGGGRTVGGGRTITTAAPLAEDIPWAWPGTLRFFRFSLFNVFHCSPNSAN